MRFCIDTDNPLKTARELIAQTLLLNMPVHQLRHFGFVVSRVGRLGQ